MRGVSKKMLISILTSVIVFVTMVATTFAWVGIFTYANTENFQLNLKTQDLDVNYFLTISATGEKESFSDEAEINEIQKQILKNQHINDDNYSDYVEYIDSLENESIKNVFNDNSKLVPSTAEVENNYLYFKSINLKRDNYFEYIDQNKQFMTFDLYLSVGAKEGIQETSNFDLSVYLTDLSNTLVGTISDYKFYNRNPFKKLPSSDDFLLSIPETTSFKVDSKNAVRFAICVYNPVYIDDNQQASNEMPIKYFIYHGGEKNPTIVNNVYDLGGCLPEDYNTALQELLVLRPNYKNGVYENYNLDYKNALQKAIERDNIDLSLTEDNSKIWNRPASTEIIDAGDKKIYNYLGVKNGIQTKMKLKIFFWFEGWDADCLAGIDQKPVNMNLTFTAGVED